MVRSTSAQHTTPQAVHSLCMTGRGEMEEIEGGGRRREKGQVGRRNNQLQRIRRGRSRLRLARFKFKISRRLTDTRMLFGA